MRTKIILAAFLIIFGFLYCKKENNNYRSAGVIEGSDPRMCVCCGGWFMKIDSVTYDFDALPTNSGIDLQKDTFPINVKLDWKLIQNACLNRISIQRIARD